MVLIKSLCIVLALIAVNYITAEDPSSSRYGGPGGYGGSGGPGGIGAPGGSGGAGGPGGSWDDERFKKIVRCNYTETPGMTCASCNQTLICLRSNLGVVRKCKRNRPYCNEGSCSSSPAEGCDATSSE